MRARPSRSPGRLPAFLPARAARATRARRRAAPTARTGPDRRGRGRREQRPERFSAPTSGSVSGGAADAGEGMGVPRRLRTRGEAGEAIVVRDAPAPRRTPARWAMMVPSGKPAAGVKPARRTWTRKSTARECRCGTTSSNDPGGARPRDAPRWRKRSMSAGAERSPARGRAAAHGPRGRARAREVGPRRHPEQRLELGGEVGLVVEAGLEGEPREARRGEALGGATDARDARVRASAICRSPRGRARSVRSATRRRRASAGWRRPSRVPARRRRGHRRRGAGAPGGARGASALAPTARQRASSSRRTAAAGSPPARASAWRSSRARAPQRSSSGTTRSTSSWSGDAEGGPRAAGVERGRA